MSKLPWYIANQGKQADPRTIGCMVGFTNRVNDYVQLVRGLKSMIFGGEGLFFASLTGPGYIWLQTFPLTRLTGRIHSVAPQTGGSRKGEGSSLGNLSNLLGGDK